MRHEPQQRIRVGLTGLAVVFLLVLLGAAISRSGQDGTPTVNSAVNLDTDEPNEPLAEIGAAPGQPQGNDAAPNATAPAPHPPAK